MNGGLSKNPDDKSSPNTVQSEKYVDSGLATTKYLVYRRQLLRLSLIHLSRVLGPVPPSKCVDIDPVLMRPCLATALVP
jgi:hypothetical protein